MSGTHGGDRLRARLLRAITDSRLEPGEAFPCPYLPDRDARHLNLIPDPLGPGVYHALLDLNFRRVGEIFYRPACGACTECRTLRIPVASFVPSRAQRRCLARNADLEIALGRPSPSDEKHALYQKYLGARHVGPMDGTREEFERFLYTSSVETLEVCYRAAGRLVAVGIADALPEAWSAVYCFFDPDEARRSPGTLNVLTLLEQARSSGAAWLYLGYYVAGCRQMSYKAAFGPCETLGADGAFQRLTARLGDTSLKHR